MVKTRIVDSIQPFGMNEYFIFSLTEDDIIEFDRRYNGGVEKYLKCLIRNKDIIGVTNLFAHFLRTACPCVEDVIIDSIIRLCANQKKDFGERFMAGLLDQRECILLNIQR